jgi:hypothetical protein
MKKGNQTSQELERSHKFFFSRINDEINEISQLSPGDKISRINNLSYLIKSSFAGDLNVLEICLCRQEFEAVRFFLSLDEYRLAHIRDRKPNPLFFYLSHDDIKEVDDKILDLLLTDENLIEYHESLNVINYLILAQDKISESNLEKILKRLKELQDQGRFNPCRSKDNNYIYFLFYQYDNIRQLDFSKLPPEINKLHRNNLDKLKILNQYFPLGEEAPNFEDNSFLFFIVENGTHEAIDIILESGGKINFFLNDNSRTIFHSLIQKKDARNFIKFLKNLYENDEITSVEKARILHHVYRSVNSEPISVISLLASSNYKTFKDDLIKEAKKYPEWFQKIFTRTIEENIDGFLVFIAQLRVDQQRPNQQRPNQQRAIQQRAIQQRVDQDKETQRLLEEIKTSNDKIRKEKSQEFLKIFNSNAENLKHLLGLDKSQDLFIATTSGKKQDFVGIKFSENTRSSENIMIFKDVFFSHFRELKNQLFLSQKCLFVNFSFNQDNHIEIIKKAFEDIEAKFRQRLFLKDKTLQESQLIGQYFEEFENANVTISRLNVEIEKLTRLKTAFELKGNDVSKQNSDIDKKTQEVQGNTEIRNNALSELTRLGFDYFSKKTPSSPTKQEVSGMELSSATNGNNSLIQDYFSEAFSSHTAPLSKQQRAEEFRRKNLPSSDLDSSDPIPSDPIPSSPTPSATILNLSTPLINPRQNYQEILTGQVTIFDRGMALTRFNPDNLEQFLRGCLLSLSNRDYNFDDLDQEMTSEEFNKNFENFCKSNPRKDNDSNRLKFLFHQKFEIIEQKLLEIPNLNKKQVRDLLYMFLANCHQTSRESLLKLYENPSIREGIGHASGADIATLKKSIFALDKFFKISNDNPDINQSYKFLRSVEEGILNPLSGSKTNDSQDKASYREFILEDQEYFSRLIADFSEQKDHDQFYSEAKKQTREFCQKYCQLIVDLSSLESSEDKEKLISEDFYQQIEKLRRITDKALEIDDKTFFQTLNNQPDLINLVYEISNEFNALEFRQDNDPKAKLSIIARIFNKPDFFKHLSEIELESYSNIIAQEGYKNLGNVESLRVENIKIFREAEKDFVEKSIQKERANGPKGTRSYL